MTDFTYAKVIEHSVGPGRFHLPVATLEIGFPRIVLAEYNTHRVISKNTSSSRAIPFKRMIERIRAKPYAPFFWGANQPGMSADNECNALVLDPRTGCWMTREEAWAAAMESAIDWAEAFSDAGYHKQNVNRLIENFGYVTMVTTSVHWANFFALRIHPKAQPEIQSLAGKMKEALANSTPKVIGYGEWHLPYVLPDERSLPVEDQIKLSVARCASTSYDTVEGHQMTTEKAYGLFDKLFGEIPIHASPAEHQATPLYVSHFSIQEGNLTGYKQYRHSIPHNTIKD